METFKITWFAENLQSEKVSALFYSLENGWFVFYEHASMNEQKQVHRIRESEVRRIDIVND